MAKAWTTHPVEGVITGVVTVGNGLPLLLFLLHAFGEYSVALATDMIVGGA